MKRIILIILYLITVNNSAFCNQSIYNPPTNLQITDLQPNEVILSWNGCENAVAWIVNYKVLMAEQSTEITLGDTIIYIPNLISGLRYIWKVKMIDNNGDTTAWSDISSFLTPDWEVHCSKVEQLLLINMNANGLSVQWNPTPEHLSWEIVCGEVGSNPDNEGIRHTTSNLNHIFANLTNGQIYQIAVRGVCNGMLSNWKFMNVKYVAENYFWTLPIQITFETEEENSRVGLMSGISNPWVVGTATNATNMGSKSLYISCDEGSTTNYIATPTRSYAFVNFYIPADASSYYVDFKWKSNTTNPNDKLSIYMLEENAHLNLDQLPENLYFIGQTQYGGNYPSWQSEHLEMPANTFGYMRKVLFAWESDSAGSLALALDDIYITGRYCPAPHNLWTNNLTTSSATLHWQANEEQSVFNLQYRTMGDSTWQTINEIDTGYVLTNLNINTTYQYRIQADCESEQSFWSEADTFTTTIVINPPNHFRLTALGDISATLQWSVENGTDRWLFEYKELAGSYITSLLNDPEIMLNHLAPNTSYIARVRGISANDDTSSYSNEVVFQTYCTKINIFPHLALVDTIRCTSEGYCEMETCWRSNADTLFSPYFDFMPLYTPVMNVKYKASAICQLLIYTEGGGYTLLENLSPTSEFQTKTYDMRAYENEAVVRFAFVNFAHTTSSNYEFAATNFKVEDVCVSPERLHLVSLNRNVITINWEAYQNNTQWQIVLRNLTGGDSLSVFTDTRSWTYESLVPDNEYIIGIRGICSAGDTAETFTEMNFTAEDNVCMPPYHFECEYYSDGNERNIVCTWDSVVGVLHWEIQYRSQYAIDFTNISVWLDNEYTIRDVNPNEKYYIRARSVCMHENDTSHWTELNTVTTNSLSALPHENRSFEIYPNPAQGVINVKTNLPELKQAQLINSQGVVLQTWESLPMQINISNLTAGVYFIKVLINDIPVSKRFTIKN